MLKSIHIDNYALIEELDIDLDQGLTIITGETGAGKSIFLGALGLLLGKRADTAVLKSKTRKCVVEGVFGIAGYGLEPFFTENELDFTEETIIRREITPTGKSRAFINDTPANLTQLQELSLQLIDIHSQHQNLSLNSENYLRGIIDAYAGIRVEVDAYGASYHDYLKLKNHFGNIRENFQKDKDNLDLLTHQYSELQGANLKTGELGELQELSEILGNADEIRNALEGTLLALNEDQSGIIIRMSQVLEALKRIRKHFPPADELCERTESLAIELKDIQSDLFNHADKVELDPTRLEKANLRIDQLNTLFHKYRVSSEEDLITIRDQLDEKLQGLALSDSELEELRIRLQDQEKHILEKAESLSQKRRSVFHRMEEQIQELLQELGMKNAVFNIRHEATDLCQSGFDRIQFFFSANRNVPVQNITRVASGGELSRLMLAIKYLISGASGLPTILFDEVDTGVSGEIADRVGKLIETMADLMQVINITHLPQVASKGDHHFVVYKEQAENSTRTLMRKLNEQDRLSEIARMLSGDSVSEAAIANARVLLGHQPI